MKSHPDVQGKFECLGENSEKQITVPVPTLKEIKDDKTIT